MRRPIVNLIFFIVLLIVLAGCGSQAAAQTAQPTPTDTPIFDTLTATPIDSPASTPIPTNTQIPATVPTHAVNIPTQAPKPTSPALNRVPTQPPVPTPTPTQATGVNGNPWGYNFDATNGYEITDPPSDFCVYFTCIKSFDKGTTYVVECADGMYSRSGGLSGVCSDHGGYLRTLYAH